VEELGLDVMKHPTLYRLQWFHGSRKLKVNKQVLLTVETGKYQNEIICDVVPIQASHSNLGRPW
jgi:hypothetical protein